MRKKVVTLSCIGFLVAIVLDMAVPFITSQISEAEFSPYSVILLERTGSPAAALLLTLVVYGLYGAACLGGTIVYEIERWPLALSTFVHYLIVSIGYLIPAWILCWNLSLQTLLLIEALMTIGYFLIWLFIYLRYKALVRELNELTKKRDEK